MAQGLPYDSDEGRAQAAAITALMTGHAYGVSATLAKQVGPFAGYQKDANRWAKLSVCNRVSLRKLTHLWLAKNCFLRRPAAGTKLFEHLTCTVCAILKPHFLATDRHNWLNDGLWHDGIEPDLGLVKVKKLVGGGTMSIVNQTVPRALRALATASFKCPKVMNRVVPYLQRKRLDAHLKMWRSMIVFSISM